MNVKVSIIVPVYNTGEYLKQCLESIVNQTLKEIEVICVDDGSTDNSPEILKEFVKKDKRIKILTQENKGLSGARNSGMKIATGEYIGFVDSDDWVDETMFEKMYENAKLFDSNISMCSISLYNDKTCILTSSDAYMTLGLFPEHFENRCFSFKETYDFIFRICVVAWNKIYKKSFLDFISVEFVEGLFFEDNVFFCETFMQSEKNSIIKEPLYIYRVGSGGSIVAGSDVKKLDFFKIFNLEEAFLKDKGLYEELKDYFLETKKNTLNYWYKKLTDEQVKKEYLQKMQVLYPNY